MATTTPNVIMITPNRDHYPVFDLKSAAAIAPGELVEKNASGLLIPHGTQGANAYPWFADFNPFAPVNTSPAIAQDWASGDNVRYIRAISGEEIYAWLGPGQTAAIDSPLISDGAGALDVYTPQAVDEGGSATYTINPDAIVAYAMEAVNNSGGSDPVRIKVMVA